VEASFAQLHFAVVRVGLANFVLEAFALEVFIEPLESGNHIRCLRFAAHRSSPCSLALNPYRHHFILPILIANMIAATIARPTIRLNQSCMKR
jgi:hypothetical protein